MAEFLSMIPARYIDAVLSVFLVVISASGHEYGHALAAHLCGDDTAKERGRLTLNPFAHIDPVGSVLLPLILVLTSGTYIAFAKPVPYNSARLKNPGQDDAMVAIAGPAMNLVQAIVGAIVFRLASPVLLGAGVAGVWAARILLLYTMVNVSLMLFNLLPIPPLDGSKLLLPFLGGKARERYHQIQRYALPVTLIALYVLPRYLGIDPVGWWISGVGGRILDVLLGV